MLSVFLDLELALNRVHSGSVEVLTETVQYPLSIIAAVTTALLLLSVLMCNLEARSEETDIILCACLLSYATLFPAQCLMDLLPSGV
jgi:hypothetical protein